MTKIDPFKSPALAFIAVQTIIAQQAGRAVIASGMGVDEQLLVIDDPQAIMSDYMIALHKDVSTWRGFDVRHIYGQLNEMRDCSALDLFAALDAGSRHLTQEALDFLTMRDRSDAILETRIFGESIPDDLAEWAFDANKEFAKLAMSFRRQLVDDAEPHRGQVSSGVYVLERTPMPRLDQQLVYDQLRLVVTRAGLFVSVIRDNAYVPFFWSPEMDTNTSQVWVGVDVRFCFDILCAAIWRDVCVTEEVMVEHRNLGRRYQRSKSQQHDDAIRFPKRVYISRWGDDQDRDSIARSAQRAHMVRSFYRVLPDGQTASEQAILNAQEAGELPPPEGYTFVKSHERGNGESMPTHRRVVCEGLWTATVLLS